MVHCSPSNPWDGIIVIKTAIISYTIICDRVGLASLGAASAQVSGVPPAGRSAAAPPPVGGAPCRVPRAPWQPAGAPPTLS
jgi:hypothetical protein